MNDNRADRTEEFVGLFAQGQYEIHSHILTLVHNWTDADDVMQATSIVLWRKFDQFERGSDFVAWACRIAQLEVKNFRRVRGRDRLFFDESLMQSLASVRLAMADRLQEEREWLTDCVAKLRSDDRELIHRCYGGKDGTAKDVAVALGRPVNTVYKALIRIRRSLLECVQRTINGADRP